MQCEQCEQQFQHSVTHWQGALVSSIDVSISLTWHYSFLMQLMRPQVKSAHHTSTANKASCSGSMQSWRRGDNKNESLVYFGALLHSWPVGQTFWLVKDKRAFVVVHRMRAKWKRIKWKSATRPHRCLSVWLSLSKNITFIPLSLSLSLQAVRLSALEWRLQLNLKMKRAKRNRVHKKRKERKKKENQLTRWNIGVTYCEKDGTSHTKVRDACSTQDNLNGSRFEHRKIKVTSFLKADADRFISHFVRMTRNASRWSWMMPLWVNCMVIHMIVVSINGSRCTGWSNWRLSLHS